MCESPCAGFANSLNDSASGGSEAVFVSIHLGLGQDFAEDVASAQAQQRRTPMLASAC